jgi:D-alanyl-D-alanine carboxypeptidase (penicillin-binding protein 5/6)
MVKELGLPETSVADASGFSPNTISTAPDMVQLGAMYMQDPVLRDIATKTDATIPVAGMITNYNSLINNDGLLGIKVGDTDEAGRCFLVADIRNKGPEDIVSIAVVVGADNLETAMIDARTILDAGNAGYDQLATN